MVRISRLTDYAIVLLTHFVAHRGDAVLNARDLAARTRMPAPTVSKLLKALSKGGLLVSQRGARGGYRLARAPEQIAVSDIVRAIEGPIHITDCSGELEGLCALEERCGLRVRWTRINQVIRGALEGLTLADMAEPPPPLSAPTLPAAALEREAP
jgi:FeS assembly SUF system regulator